MKSWSAKYRNPDNPAETWAGRGRKPKWVEDRLEQGTPLEALLINQSAPRERDEALDHVVRNHGVRQILDEEAGLLFVHVDRYPAELA